MSRLLESGEEFRNNQISKNKYDKNTYYSESHPNALSDGDEFGKGELNGSIGGITDIDQRNKQKVKNLYTSNKEYGQSGTV